MKIICIKKQRQGLEFCVVQRYINDLDAGGVGSSIWPTGAGGVKKD
jgi:hypothetical protein